MQRQRRHTSASACSVFTCQVHGGVGVRASGRNLGSKRTAGDKPIPDSYVSAFMFSILSQSTSCSVFRLRGGRCSKRLCANRRFKYYRPLGEIPVYVRDDN